MSRDSLLTTVGARVRGRREAAGLSRRQLSETSKVSERFLAQLEAGRGNISLARFADVAAALGATAADLLDGVGDDRADSIALLGLRGAGKSTVGAALAARRGVPFIELDQRIEDAAGMPLGALFEMHGEALYRRLEREVLAALLASSHAFVLATGGSLVTSPETFELLRRRTRTVWLRARPEDHWNRVVAQGDQRPMAEKPHAFAELRALLAARESLYAAASQVVDTSERSVEDVIATIEQANHVGSGTHLSTKEKPESQ